MIQREKRTGRPVIHGAITVKPQYEKIMVRLPFGWFAHQRPVALLVEQDGQTRRVPIVDATRRVQAGLVALGLVIRIVMSLLKGREQRSGIKPRF